MVAGAMSHRYRRSLLPKLYLRIGDDAVPKFVELPKLTPAETEVVKLIALGYGQHEIGLMLDCSWRTVDTHRTNIYRKMGFENAVDATHYALARGMVGNKFLVTRGDGVGAAETAGLGVRIVACR
jgi:DNA-binding NarL/FixJ family response regulator